MNIMSSQMDIKDRLNFLIDKLKLSYSKFSQITKIPYASIQNYVYGKRVPTIENLQKIHIHLNVNLNWLLTGEGDMFIKPPAQTIGETPAEYKENKFIGEDFVLIPMVSGKISAGKGLAPIEDAEIVLKLAFRLEWIKRKGDYTKMSLIRVEGDSMEPTLLCGDIVLVDGNRNFIDLHGGIYAIFVNDSIMIKRVQILLKEKALKIISDNPKYEPIILSPEEVHVIGKIIWIGREIEHF